MPTISRFYGISIRMYFADHPPPHIHAIYDAVITIEDAQLLRGELPDRALRLVREWVVGTVAPCATTGSARDATNRCFRCPR